MLQKEIAFNWIDDYENKRGVCACQREREDGDEIKIKKEENKII